MAHHNDSLDPWALEALEHLPHTAGEPLLSVEAIEGVEPLDDQFGAHPPKTVPDAVYDLLFGQFDLTDEERQAVGDGSDDLPRMQTYAILDAAKVSDLVELLEASGLQHLCLFKGDAYDELKTVAPWVVRLEEGNTFTRRLFTTGKAPWNLWNKNPGIYVRSRRDIEALQRHLRKFTKIQDENGKWHFFRFWEQWYFPVIMERQSKLPSLSSFFGRLIGDDTFVAARPIDATMFKTRNVHKPRTDRILLTDMIREDMSLAVFYQNMIDAAFDLHELHPVEVQKYGDTPKSLWPLLFDFADEVKQAGLKDPELRARMMILSFIMYREPWPAFVNLPFWQQIKSSEKNTDDLFEDFCARLKYQNIRNGTAESIWW